MVSRFGRSFLVAIILAAFGLSAAGSVSAQQPGTWEFPAEVRGQIDDMLGRSVLAPPVSPAATCGTVVVGQDEELDSALETHLLAPSIGVALAAPVSRRYRPPLLSIHVQSDGHDT
jgi:hypothetical protein